MIKRVMESFKLIINYKFKNKKVLKFVISVAIFIILIYCIESVYAAAQTPTLVTKLGTAFKKLKEYMVKLAGPLAAVAIITGIVVRKLSFGDEEKMIAGKRIIVNAIGGYFVILLVDLIIKFIEALV